MPIPKQNVTIKEIAKSAGVSTTTVSSVLNNGRIIVGPGTKARILDAVKKLGYRPSRKAKQLRMQKNRIIAFQIESRVASDEMWRPTVLLTLLQVQGVCAYAYSKGYHVDIIAPQQGEDLPEMERQIINENAVDGVILSGWRDLPERQIERILSGISRCGIPAVTMDHKVHERGCPSVSINLVSGIRKALARVKELGHKQLAYIGGTGMLDPRHVKPRFSIIMEELRNYGLELPPRHTANIQTEVDSYRKTLEILKGPGSRPDCVIYHGDHMAMAGIKALTDAGLKIPEDISVISFDNAPYAHGSPVPLSTIDQKFHEQGVMLAKQLIDQIEEPQIKVPSLSVLESDFIERSSLGYAAKK
jgi:LacI family transcriptional regulator